MLTIFGFLLFWFGTAVFYIGTFVVAIKAQTMGAAGIGSFICIFGGGVVCMGSAHKIMPSGASFAESPIGSTLAYCVLAGVTIITLKKPSVLLKLLRASRHRK